MKLLEENLKEKLHGSAWVSQSVKPSCLWLRSTKCLTPAQRGESASPSPFTPPPTLALSNKTEKRKGRKEGREGQRGRKAP